MKDVLKDIKNKIMEDFEVITIEDDDEEVVSEEVCHIKKILIYI